MNPAAPIAERPRLRRQIDLICEIMLPLCDKYGWWTLREIVTVLLERYDCAASEAGVSARLRECRKLCYLLQVRIRSGNLREYRLVAPAVAM